MELGRRLASRAVLWAISSFLNLFDTTHATLWSNFINRPQTTRTRPMEFPPPHNNVSTRHLQYATLTNYFLTKGDSVLLRFHPRLKFLTMPMPDSHSEFPPLGFARSICSSAFCTDTRYESRKPRGRGPLSSTSISVHVSSVTICILLLLLCCVYCCLLLVY
jgi:hypothetical protein